jgi:hypothetical protein
LVHSEQGRQARHEVQRRDEQRKPGATPAREAAHPTQRATQPRHAPPANSAACVPMPSAAPTGAGRSACRPQLPVGKGVRAWVRG